MKKVNANVILLFLFLIFFTISFVSASFSIGKGNITIKNYGPGSYLSGSVNISFQNQSLDSEFRDNQGNNVSLFKLLNSSKNKNHSYTCDVTNCGSNYASKEKISSKTYQLAKGEELLFGIEFRGILENISLIKFNIESNARESCENQLTIDILDDGSYEFSNTKVSNSVCSGTYTGCYNASLGNDFNLAITNNPLCQKINVSEAPGYYIGAWIAETSIGASSIGMSMYDKYGVEIEACSISKTGMNSSGGEFSCSVNHLTITPTEYYICLYTEGTGGDYKTRGYSLAQGCGFSGSTIKNGTAAYYIFAKPKKFGAVGSLSIGDESGGENDFAPLASHYISSHYATNDCTNGCYVPIKIIADVAQNITIKNFSIEYDQKDLPGIEENKFHTLEKIPAKINSKYQILFVDKLFKLPVALGNISYLMNLDGKTVIDEKIQIKNISMNLIPTKVPIASPTVFKISIISNSSPVKYFWTFKEGTKETLTNQVSYTYLEEGDHDLIVEVQTADGGIFSKTFVISVQSAKETANNTLIDLEKKFKTINSQILSLDSFTKSKISDNLNLTYTESQLNSLKLRFSKATNESDYIKIVNELNLIELPESIVQSSTNFISYYPKKTDIELDYLTNITGEHYDENKTAEYLVGVIAWNQANLDTKISLKEISYKYDSNLVPFMRTFNLQFTPKGELSGSTYLIIKDLRGLEFNVDSTQRNGYSYILINGKSTISFSTTQNVGFVDLPLFISPAISSLPVSISGDIPEHKNPWWILVILFSIVILLGLIVYFVLHRWYDKKYEQSLFPNKNHLYNLITYINNQKTAGVPEEEIRENLRKAKWSTEQIRYVMRKYLGKNTGMWKPGKVAKLKKEDISPVEFNKGIRYRNLALHIILGLITGGIYFIIWLFISSYELKKITKKAPGLGIIFTAFLFSFLVLILNLALNFFLNFLEESVLGTIMAILLIISIMLLIFILIQYSKALEEITKFSWIGSFLLLLLVYPIGTIIAQVQLNKKANIGQKVNKQS